MYVSDYQIFVLLEEILRSGLADEHEIVVHQDESFAKSRNAQNYLVVDDFHWNKTFRHSFGKRFIKMRILSVGDYVDLSDTPHGGQDQPRPPTE